MKQKRFFPITALLLSATITFSVTLHAHAFTPTFSDIIQIQTSAESTDYEFTVGVGQAILLDKKLGISTTAKYVSHNTAVATVTSKGKVSAKSVGDTCISVQTEDGNFFNCNITVKSAPETVTLQKSKMNMGIGQNYQLVSTLTPSDAVTCCTWSSNKKSIATVNSSGLVTAVKKGTADITVRTSNGKTTTCTVNVKPAPDKILLDKYCLTLDIGKSYTFTKTLSPTSAFASYSWKSSNPSVASVNYLGKVFARKSGVAYITVATHNGKSATCQVSVNRPPVQSIVLDKDSATIFTGETVTLNASVTPDDASKICTWTSNNPSVATVDKNGNVSGVNVGDAVITVQTANGKTATCTVTVKESYADAVIRLVNEERIKAGVHPLEKREDVCELARIRAEEISSQYSHKRPNGEYYEDIFKEYGVSYYFVNENIAGGFTSPEDTVQAWMESSGHKKYILSPLYNGTGAGIYEKNGLIFWVELFIR